MNLDEASLCFELFWQSQPIDFDLSHVTPTLPCGGWVEVSSHEQQVSLAELEPQSEPHLKKVEQVEQPALEEQLEQPALEEQMEQHHDHVEPLEKLFHVSQHVKQASHPHHLRHVMQLAQPYGACPSSWAAASPATWNPTQTAWQTQSRDHPVETLEVKKPPSSGTLPRHQMNT